MNPSYFQQEIFIPFHFVDAAGVLFFGHTFTLAHQVFETFVIQTLSCSWQDWFHHPDRIVPIKNAEASFHAPIFAGLPCLIKLSIEEIREHSFCVSYEFIQRDQVCCHVRTIHIFCDRKNKSKQPIPNQIKANLIPFLKNGQSMLNN
jgi:acyl-CoA thioester hydrolase/1,4-dihydroxy-2-naphthoyl-CoA hydrolase